MSMGDEFESYDLVALAASLNFPVDDLIFVEHGGIAE